MLNLHISFFKAFFYPAIVFVRNEFGVFLQPLTKFESRK